MDVDGVGRLGEGGRGGGTEDRDNGKGLHVVECIKLAVVWCYRSLPPPSYLASKVFYLNGLGLSVAFKIFILKGEGLDPL